MSNTPKSNYKNPFSATLEGIRAVFARQVKVSSLRQNDRLDGKTVLIDGASSGLGFAVAVQLAQRGARVIMVCRSGIPEKGEKVKRRSGNTQVEMIRVDYSDYNSILDLVHTIKENYAPLDIVISNAAIVPRLSRKTPQGLEEMFMVNYLSKFIFINHLLKENCITARDHVAPRIIFVTSESHRHPPEFRWEEFGVFKNYGMNKTVEYYGYYKLLLTTFAVELSRRLNTGGRESASVFSLCPGPVNSGIAREAPGIFQPLMKLVFTIFFKPPAKAAEPVMYLAASPAMEGITFDYLFKMTRKPVDEKAMDPFNGKKLWELSEKLASTLSGWP